MAPSSPRWSVRSGTASRSKASHAVCDNDDVFFRIPRANTYCKSVRPSDDFIKRKGDFTQSWLMKSFFDGTIDLSLQVDDRGCIILNRDDAERVRSFRNPLRDPLVMVKRDGMFSLKDGFHRLCEALARGYRSSVHTVVLDMDTDDTDTDDMEDM